MRININNTDKIEAALAEVNGRAKSQTITNAYEVAFIAETAELKLSDLPIALRRGATVAYRPEGPCGSYKYQSTTTVIYLERGAKYWFLTGAAQSPLWPRQSELFNISISQHQANEIARRALSPFTVRKEPTSAAA